MLKEPDRLTVTDWIALALGAVAIVGFTGWLTAKIIAFLLWAVGGH